MSHDDFLKRFAAISVPELRQYIDLAIGYIRAQRNALAVHAGMTIEEVPGPIPELDLGGPEAQRAFEEILEHIPLLRTPLTEEERAQLIVPTETEKEQAKELIEQLAEDPEAFEELMEETGLDMTHDQVIAIRDSMHKSDMISELQQEIEALQTELLAYREHLSERTEGLLDTLMAERKSVN